MATEQKDKQTPIKDKTTKGEAMNVQTYSKRNAFKQLRSETPGRAARHQDRLRELLDIDPEIIASWRTLHPRASVLYLGSIDVSQKRKVGVVLRWDICGRINAYWVEREQRLRQYEQSNNVTEVLV